MAMPVATMQPSMMPTQPPLLRDEYLELTGDDADEELEESAPEPVLVPARVSADHAWAQ